jgi:hypothetical protein
MANHGYFAGQIFARPAADCLRASAGVFGATIKKARQTAGPFSLFPRTAVSDSGRLFLDD